MSHATMLTSAPTHPPSVASKRLLPWLVAVAFFMEALDTTILNTAVPVVSQALGVAPLSMKSVLASYTLSLAVFIPISGWMADRFGTRRVFACAIGIFTLGSFLCGMATNIHGGGVWSRARPAFSRWDHFSAACRPIFTCWSLAASCRAAADP